MERILELALQNAEQAEVFRIERDQLPVCFRAGRLATVEEELSVGIALRIIRNGRLGFSSTSDPREAEELVARAVRAAEFGPEVALEFPAVREAAGEGAFFDREVAELKVGAMIRTGEEMLEIVRAEFPEVALIADVSRSIERVRIINSSGGDVSYARTRYQAFLQVLMTLDGDRAELEHGYSSNRLDDGPLRLAHQALWRFRNCARVAPLRGGRLPVIFTGLGFRGLYVPLFSALNRANVERGTSLLSGKLGEQIADSRFTLIDDATAPELPASCPFDDEGTPTSRHVLIENGVVRGFFCDLRTAGRYGGESTGNGFKKGSLYEGFRLDAPPSSVPSNFIIEPGASSWKEMIAEIDEGVIVDDVIGAGQGNNLNGEFSMSITLGYKIEKGEIVGRVKDVMVSGNIFELLPNIRCLSRERFSEDTLFGRYLAPWICFDGVSVAVE